MNANDIESANRPARPVRSLVLIAVLLLMGGYGLVLIGAAIVRQYPKQWPVQTVDDQGRPVVTMEYATQGDLGRRAAGTVLALAGAALALSGVGLFLVAVVMRFRSNRHRRRLR